MLERLYIWRCQGLAVDPLRLRPWRGRALEPSGICNSWEDTITTIAKGSRLMDYDGVTLAGTCAEALRLLQPIAAS